jgi:hypothetical protein
MNGINILFVISCIFIPLLLISINYDSISNFYAYDVPLNSFVLESNFLFEQDRFQEIYQNKDSQCLTTLNNNLFCYEKPRLHSETMLISYVIGTNGINGEMHLDPVDVGVGYFTMKNMTGISGDSAMITFADNDYKVGNKNRVDYEITDKFEFDTIIEKFDTFIAKCNNYEGTSVTIVQYLGVDTIDGNDYFLTWHMLASSEQGVTCDYPQIIQHSLKHNFKEL